MTKRIIASIVLLALLGAIVVGCASQSGSGATNTTPPAGQEPTGKPGTKGGAATALTPDR